MAKTVLIVEDERAIVEILKFNLKREGYETLEALDGETGLLLAQTKDPDLILLDVMLPKMNGFDICKTLRAENRTTPIIMLTAREEEMDKVLSLIHISRARSSRPRQRCCARAGGWCIPHVPSRLWKTRA